MNERIWTPTRIRTVVVSTLFGVALAEGMVLMFDVVVKVVLYPHLGASNPLLTDWVNWVTGLLSLPCFISGIRNAYIANGILGAIAGATIGVVVSQFIRPKTASSRG